jgi:hypothetical protein
VQEGAIARLVDIMKKPNFRHVSLKLLYHISMDDKCKSMFTYTDCIPIITNMVTNFPEQNVDKTLIALAINLSNNTRNAEIMAGDDTLNTLLSRLFQTKDVLLAKMLRNISQHDGGIKRKFAEFVSDITALARQTEDPNLLVELLGIMGNMTLTDIPFAQVCILDAATFSDSPVCCIARYQIKRTCDKRSTHPHRLRHGFNILRKHLAPLNHEPYNRFPPTSARSIPCASTSAP